MAAPYTHDVYRDDPRLMMLWQYSFEQGSADAVRWEVTVNYHYETMSWTVEEVKPWSIRTIEKPVNVVPVKAKDELEAYQRALEVLNKEY